MAAKFAKFLLAMLLSVPISGFGLIAVLGMPRIQALSAALIEHASKAEQQRNSSWEEDLLGDSFGHSAPRWGESDSSSRNPVKETASAPGHAAHPFAMALEQATNHDSTHSPRVTSGAPGPESQFTTTDWPRPDSSPPRAGHISDPANPGSASQTTESIAMTSPFPVTTPASPETAQGATLTWREAALKLAEMGIERYHLEPGSTGHSFLFVCLFSPADSPQVTHRFEAEADEPLTAVNQTLGQVDRWMRERHAMRTFPATQSVSFQSSLNSR